MRTLRWIVLTAAVGLVAAGCNGKLSDNGGPPTDSTPSPITSISAPVVGFGGTADALFEARDPVHGEALASGTLVASAMRFDAEFLPLADVPPDVLESGLASVPETGFEEGDLTCDVVVVPDVLRATGVFMFSKAEGLGMMVLSTFAFFFGQEAEPFPVDARFYLFLLADRAGRIQGTCEEPDTGLRIEYAVDLVAGWNSVAFVLTSVDADGEPVAWRFQDEPPVPEARWFYFGLDFDFPDEPAGEFIEP